MGGSSVRNIYTVTDLGKIYLLSTFRRVGVTVGISQGTTEDLRMGLNGTSMFRNATRGSTSPLSP